MGGHEDLESGIYFGFAGVDIDDTGRKVADAEQEDGEGNAAPMIEKEGQ